MTSKARYSKMRLLSEEEYDRYKQQKALKDYDPRVAVMATAAANAKLLLNQKKKPSQLPQSNLRFQLQQYERAMDTYRALQKNPTPPAIEGLKATLPPTITITPTAMAIDPVAATAAPAGLAETEEEEGGAEDAGGIGVGEAAAAPTELTNTQVRAYGMALAAVPGPQKSKASLAIEFLKTIPHKINVNEQMELVLNGKTHPKSNFIDLFAALYAPKTSRQPLPLHFHLFKEALLSFNIPISFFPSSFQTGKGLTQKRIHHFPMHPPPGHKPHILRLYK